MARIVALLLCSTYTYLVDVFPCLEHSIQLFIYASLRPKWPKVDHYLWNICLYFLTTTTTAAAAAYLCTYRLSIFIS